MANTSCGQIDLYDQGGGTILVRWGAFSGPVPDSYNVYVNGVLNQNVTAQLAIVTGLSAASYAVAAVAPNPGNSKRPQSMPPVGVVTPSTTYDIKVAAVKAGVETAASVDRFVTAAPVSLMLATPMRRPFPFPNSAPGG